MKREEILKILDDLLRLEDILACMVARKGLEGLIPASIKLRNIDFWVLLKNTTDPVFDLIDKFYESYKLERLYLEMNQYTVIVATITSTISLIVVIPSLANMGLLDVEIENTKRKIVEILKRPGE
jgi:predicted regulator of Ras-like GTPase activity (Roadblock/LC7/MglB family)